MFSSSLLRFFSVARKEFLHILRDPMTLFFTLFIPICEMFMLGYAIDTNVRFVRTAVLDLANTQESQRLLRQFENSKDFLITSYVESDADLLEAIVAGKARIGIKIPEDYSRTGRWANSPDSGAGGWFGIFDRGGGSECGQRHCPARVAGVDSARQALAR